MILRSQNELESTRAKLARLEARYESLQADTTEDERVRQLTLRSLNRYINQFKEDIARYEASASNGGRSRMLPDDAIQR